MKKLTASLIAASLMLPAAPALAQHDRHDRSDRHDRYDRHGQRDWRHDSRWHHFRKGQRFDRRHAYNYRVIDYRAYRQHLRPPPRGYRWVRSGDDALMVGITTGVVTAVVAGMFLR